MIKPLKALCLLVLLLAFSFPSRGQGSCSTSSTIVNHQNISNQITTATEVWYSFTATGSSANISFNNQLVNDYDYMTDLYLYSGTCSGLTELEHTSSSAFTDSTMRFFVNYLTENQTYYIKATRAAQNCSCSRDTVLYSIGLSIASAAKCTPSSCIVWNESFSDTVSLTSFNNPFGQGSICYWLASHGTPQIVSSATNTTPYSARMWALGTPTSSCADGVTGEGIYQTLSTALQPNEPYYFVYNIRNSGSNTIPNVFFRLANGLTPSTGSCIPNVTTVTVDQLTNVSSTAWTQRGICYTPNTLWNQIWIYPTTTNQNAQVWLSVDDVQIYRMRDAGTNNQVACGTGVTIGPECPIPGATYSWSPTTGLSNPNIANPVASPTVTTTYTLTVTAPNNACSTTATVTVQAGMSSVIAANQSVCIGQNVQLSASGATTYSWSPSTGLSNPNIANPVASPTVTTTYTVTGTDTLGCQDSQPVTVTVNPLPGCSITGSITSACSNTGQFSTTSVSGASYSWSVSPAATITSGQGTNTVNIDFTGNVAQSYTVSVVVTNTVTSCQSTCTYFVSACCTPADGLTLFNDTSSNYNSIMTGQVGINGLFVVDNNCTFYGLDVKLGYNARILILPGASLTITDDMTGIPSRLYACDYMWDGIYIDGSTASLTVNDGSSIEDAQNAIVSNNGGVYTIGGTPSTGTVKLNKNYKNIIVNSYSNAHTGTVTATEITCNNSVTPVTYTTTNLRPPHSNERTYVGVEVNSVTNATPLAIGSASNANLQNDFDNMDYGIIATNSNVTVKNNEFMNITSPGFSKKTTSCPKGTAICARGNSSIWTNGRTVTVGGANTNEPNTIRDGAIGIDAASNLNLIATYNTFSNLTQVGITAARNYLKTVTCENNTFRDIPLGIKGFDLRGSTISMSSNSMNMKNKNNAQGIVVAETFQTPLTRYTISSNTIDTVRNGISGTALVGSKMDNNTIRLKHTTNANVYGRGIYVNGGSSPNVRKNNIYGQNRNDWWMEGVRIDLSSADTVTCNITDNLGVGQFFSGSQPFTYFAKNSMTDHLWGLLLNAGAIYQQGVSGNPNDNTWSGNFTLAQSHSFNSNGNLSPFNVQNSATYHPTNNTTTTGFFQIPFSNVTGSSNLNCALATVGSDVNAATDIGVDIAENSITYPAYSDENVWFSQWALYNYIKGNASLLDDPTIQGFYDEVDAGNIGYLYRVLNIMGNMDGQDSTDLDSALTYNSSIDPQNAIETNWQDVNNILITNAQNALDVPTDGQLSELLTIAQKCPLSDGPAVYIARAILAAYDTSYVEYEDICEQPDTSTGSGSRLMADQPLKRSNIKLYPNPNNGDMVLAYELAEDESGELVIYDLSGKAVKRVILEQEQAQMPVKAELPNGVYLYRVTVNGEVRKTDKLVILR